jgi:multicomponent Na+:H+ antiporter subunit D
MAAGKGDIAVDPALAFVMQQVPLTDWLVVAPLIICLVAGGLLLMVRKSIRQHPPIALVALGLVVASNFALLLRVVETGPVVMTMGRWLPPFGITFAADIFGVLFALTASIAALAGALFARMDIDYSERRYGFYPFLLMMMAGVNGTFLTGDLFNMYVWFEVLLISSFGMLILGSRHDQLDGALRYAFLNLVGTTIFLLTTGYLYGVFGTLNMADIARKAADLRDSGPLLTLAVLYFFAFGMKAAAFPLNFWLPASYHTPRAVVSALFAGLLTKVGVYALIRTGFTLFPVERSEFATGFAIVAALTMLLGALGALAQTDYRRMLAFMVISGIGMMLMGIAIGGTTALAGTVFYALHSMIAMTALYLLAGLMHRRMATADLAQSGGLYAASPWLAALAFVLILAVSGLPPLSGLWPKVLLIKGGLDAGAFGLVAVLLISAFLTTMALGRMFLFAFWRPSIEPLHPHLSGRGDRSAKLAMVALTLPLIGFGLYPEPVVALSINAAEWLLNPAPYVEAVFPETSANGGSVQP